MPCLMGLVTVVHMFRGVWRMLRANCGLERSQNKPQVVQKNMDEMAALYVYFFQTERAFSLKINAGAQMLQIKDAPKNTFYIGRKSSEN